MRYETRVRLIVGIIVAGLLIGALTWTKSWRALGSFPDTPKITEATAPELAPGDWINSEPLKLKELRGRVVLIEFWTFGCYNCRNTLPFIKAWDDRYRAQGLTVIGVHSPEFDEERNVENLRREVASLGIKYPVVSDNDYQTWDAYNV